MSAGQGWNDAAEVTSLDELEVCVREFGEARGFTRYSLTKLHHYPWTDCTVAASFENYEDRYLAEVYERPEAGLVDPVMQFVKTHHVPLWWTRDTYRQAGCDDLWRRGIELDREMRGGIMMALHLPAGWHVTVGFETSEIDRYRQRQVEQISAEVGMLLAHASDFLMSDRSAEIAAPAAPDLRLTSRNIEVLRSLVEGRTSKEISRELGIAERTVIKHVTQCAEKLGCPNVRRERLVARALQLNLLGDPAAR